MTNKTQLQRKKGENLVDGILKWQKENNFYPNLGKAKKNGLVIPVGAETINN